MQGSVHPGDDERQEDPRLFDSDFRETKAQGEGVVAGRNEIKYRSFDGDCVGIEAVRIANASAEGNAATFTTAVVDERLHALGARAGSGARSSSASRHGTSRRPADPGTTLSEYPEVETWRHVELSKR